MLRPLALAALAAFSAPAFGQVFTTLQQDAPAAILDVEALGRGGAVAAAPTLDSPFFSNPAHLARTDRFSLTVLGVSAGVGGNVRETYDFYDQQLGPAIEDGLDDIRENDPDRLQALYDSAFAIGTSQKTASVAVLAPSLRVRIGQIVVGAGIYGSGTVRARLSDGGAGIPYVDAYSQADVIVPFGVAGEVPGLPFALNAGATVTYVQRGVGAKAEAIDALDPDNERLYILSGSGVRLGVGAEARDIGTPGLDVALALTDIGSALDLTFDDSVVIEGPEDGPDDAAEIARLEERFSTRDAGTALRLGAAYRVPLPAVPGFPLSRVLVTADFTSHSTAELDQSVQAGLRGGVSATLGGALDLRAGISQGMPSAGVGVTTRLARIDWATYGVEDGRLLGQQSRRAYVVQLRLGWF